MLDKSIRAPTYRRSTRCNRKSAGFRQLPIDAARTGDFIPIEFVLRFLIEELLTGSDIKRL